MVYQACQAQSDLMRPFRAMARMSTPMLLDPDFLLSRVPALRQTAAACKVMELAEVTHNRPAVRIHRVLVAGEAVPVVEEPVFSPPLRRYCTSPSPAHRRSPRCWPQPYSTTFTSRPGRNSPPA